MKHKMSKKGMGKSHKPVWVGGCHREREKQNVNWNGRVRIWARCLHGRAKRIQTAAARGDGRDPIKEASIRPFAGRPLSHAAVSPFLPAGSARVSLLAQQVTRHEGDDADRDDRCEVPIDPGGRHARRTAAALARRAALARARKARARAARHAPAVAATATARARAIGGAAALTREAAALAGGGAVALEVGRSGHIAGCAKWWCNTGIGGCASTSTDSRLQSTLVERSRKPVERDNIKQALCTQRKMSWNGEAP